MSQIPFESEFKSLLRAYYRVALNVTEPTIFFPLLAAWGTFLLIPQIYGKRRVGTKKVVLKIAAYFISIVSIFFVILAAMKIPIKSIMRRDGYYRNDCVQSTKGGKLNTGWERFRDCDFTMGATCTKEQPCTPCNKDSDLDEHVLAQVSRERKCRPCDSSGALERCNFVEGKGPYCIYSGRLHPVIPQLFLDFDVRPCHTCCTRPSVPNYCYNVTRERNVTRYNFTNITTSIVPTSNTTNNSTNTSAYTVKTINETFITLINDTWLPYYEMWWDNETNPCIKEVYNYDHVMCGEQLCPNYTTAAPVAAVTSTTTPAATTTTIGATNNSVSNTTTNGTNTTNNITQSNVSNNINTTNSNTTNATNSTNTTNSNTTNATSSTNTSVRL
jgi:hypothetical protein